MKLEGKTKSIADYAGCKLLHPLFDIIRAFRVVRG
jgi:hypothetical protein